MVRISKDTNSLAAGVLLKQAIGEEMIALVFDFGQPEAAELVEICKSLSFTVYILNRATAYQHELTSYHFHKQSDIRSFYQRFTSYHLTTQAQIFKSAILDWQDKSGRLLETRPAGFYGHLMPFYSLYKSDVCNLAAYLGIPKQYIIQTTCQDLLYPGNIALTFDKLDPVLFLLTEKQLSPEEISQQYKIDLVPLANEFASGITIRKLILKQNVRKMSNDWYIFLKKLKSHLDKQPLKSESASL